MDWEDGGSNVGSRRSTANRGRDHVSERLFPMLALFDSPTLHTPFQFFASTLIVAIEMIQLLAFTLNTRFGFTLPVAQELASLVYSAHIPIWDSTFADVGYDAYLMWYGVVVVLVLVMSLFLAGGYHDFFEVSRTSIITAIAVPAVHLVCGILAVPFFHTLAANMFCHDKHLWAFPGEQCWQLKSTLLFVVSLVFGTCLLLLSLLGATVLFQDNPVLDSFMTRAHPRVDQLVAMQKLLQVLAFHLLAGPGYLIAYGLVVAVLNAGMFLAYAIVLPYYDLRMNQLRGAVHAASCVGGICIAAGGAQTSDFFPSHAAELLAMTLIPLSAVWGAALCKSRVYSECLERIDHLREYGEVFSHPCKFPSGVIAHDTVLTNLKHVEKEILDGCAPSDDERLRGSGSRRQNLTEVLVPYLENLVLDTDVEVSTRFLLIHSAACNVSLSQDGDLAASPHMVAFVARIYIKEIARQKGGIVTYHFANFVKTFCPPSKLMFALEQCEGIVCDGNAEFAVRFMSHRVYVALREHLGIHNRAQKHCLNRAKRLHKEALSDMSTFWLKLMDTKHDLMSLACLTNQITDKRNQGFQEYQKAVRDGSLDREVLNSFASFLEYVMLDKKRAEVVQMRVSELGEDLHRKMMGSVRSGGSSRKSVMNLQVSEKEKAMASNNSANIMSNTTVLLLAVVVLVCVVVLVMGTVSKELLGQTVNKIHKLGKTRTLSQLGIYEALQVKMSLETDPLTTVHIKQLALQRSVHLLSEAHNSLTFGGEASSTGSVRQALEEPSHVLHNGAASIPVGLWGLGLELLTALTSITLINVNDTAAISLLSSPADRDLSFLQANKDMALTWAYNDTISAYSSEKDSHQRYVVAGMTAALLLAVYSLILTMVVFNINFRKIGVNKIVAIHLFSLIPYPTQQQLHHASRDRIKEFARLNREADKGTEQLDTDALMVDEDDPHAVSANEPEPTHSQVKLGASIIKRDSLSTSQEPESTQATEEEKAHTVVSILMKRKRHDKKRKKKRVRFELPDLQRAPAEETKDKKKLVESMPVISDPETVGLTPEERMELLNDEETADVRDGTSQKDADTPASAASPTSPVRYAVLLGMIVVAQTVLTALAYTSFSSIADTKVQSLDLAADLRDILDYSQELRTLSRAAIHGSADAAARWDEFWRRRADSKRLQQLHRLVSNLDGVSELTAYAALVQITQELDSVEDIAMRLYMEGAALSTIHRSAVATLVYDYPSTPEKRYPTGVRDPTYRLTSSAVDFARSAPEKLQQGRSVVCSERFLAEEALLVQNVGTLWEMARDRISGNTRSKNRLVEQYTLVNIFLTAGCIVLAVLLSVTHFSNKPPTILCLLSLAGLSVLLVAALGVVYSRLDTDAAYTQVEEEMSWFNTTTQALDTQHTLLQALFMSGDARFYVRYWDSQDQSTLQWWMAWATDNPHLTDVLRVILADIDRRRSELEARHMIALEVMSWLGLLPRILQQREEHVGFRWSAEPGSVWGDYLVDRDNKTAAQQREIVRELLFGTEATAIRTEMRGGVRAVSLSLIDSLRAGIRSDSDVTEGFALAAVVICGILGVVFMTLLGLVVLNALNVVSDTVTAVVERVNAALFSSIVMKCRIAFLVLALLLGAQYVFGVRGVFVVDDKLSALDTASKREWGVARSAIAAEELLGANRNNLLQERHRTRLSEVVSELEQVRNTLSKAATLDPIVSAANTDRQYINWLELLQEAALIGTSQVDTTPSPGTTGTTSLRKQPDLVQTQLRATMRPLMDKLWESGDQAKDDTNKTLQDNWVILIILSSAVFLCSIVMYKVVFIPVMRQLVMEENGTMVLLKMIPPKVREIVPKISSYLETGVIIDEAEDAGRYPACPVINKFMKDFSDTAIKEDDCYKTIEKSKSGAIVANEFGIVQGINDVALSVLGYRRGEALDRDVKMFIPDALAAMHHMFIENYITSGVARLVGKGRDVLVKEKSGKYIHCYVILSEIRRDQHLFFVAQLDLYTSPGSSEEEAKT